jgi:hypothetical protein
MMFKEPWWVRWEQGGRGEGEEREGEVERERRGEGEEERESALWFQVLLKPVLIYGKGKTWAGFDHQ